MQALLLSVPPTLQQATIDPRLHQRHRTLTGNSGSGSCGVTALLLGPSVHKVLFVSSKSLFSESCVSSGSSMVGLMATSSKRAYAIRKCPVPRALSLQHSTADSYLHRRHSNTVLAQSLWDLWVLVHTGFV